MNKKHLLEAAYKKSCQQQANLPTKKKIYRRKREQRLLSRNDIIKKIISNE